MSGAPPPLRWSPPPTPTHSLTHSLTHSVAHRPQPANSLNNNCHSPYGYIIGNEGCCVIAEFYVLYGCIVKVLKWNSVVGGCRGCGGVQDWACVCVEGRGVAESRGEKGCQRGLRSYLECTVLVLCVGEVGPPNCLSLLCVCVCVCVCPSIHPLNCLSLSPYSLTHSLSPTHCHSLTATQYHSLTAVSLVYSGSFRTLYCNVVLLVLFLSLFKCRTLTHR